MENKKNLIAVYGSLRLGDYNYKYFENGLSHQGRGLASGVKLYSLGAYPCIVKSGNEKDTVVVDVFEVVDTITSRRIDGMEYGAGYYSDNLEVTFEDGSKAKIKAYLYKQEPKWGTPIDGGDWILHKYGQDYDSLAAKRRKEEGENATSIPKDWKKASSLKFAFGKSEPQKSESNAQ
jgi:gamma-glutamylcyclotransferase (GGCT)/AIG2-like uncharacterized protein YtfP